MNKIKVALGLSGGVDSAVSAYLLKKHGYDVSCVYLNCYDDDMPGCRGDNDRKDALAVAMHLGLPFRVLDFRKEYQAAVIDYFKKEYLSGRTPNPDVVCNRDIKFGLFMDWAIEAGFDAIATGHYAKLAPNTTIDDRKWKIGVEGGKSKIEKSNLFSTFNPLPPSSILHHPSSRKSSDVFLVRPLDEHKDQTYFLWAVPKEKFKRVLFPLGNLLKTEVREIALKIGLPVAKKKDSTGICFVGEVRVEDFLKRLGVKEKIGAVVVQPRKVGPFVAIGSHRGVWFYTIGQRHGFGITNWPSASSSLRGASRRATWQSSEAIQDKPVFYVIEKDIKKNRLVVGFGADCYRDNFEVSECNWLIDYKTISNFTKKARPFRKRPGLRRPAEYFVRLRHGGELIPCSVIGSPFSVFGSKPISFQSASSEPVNRKLANQTISLLIPQRGIAPGQSAVFYDETGIVLGGGIIQ